MKDVVTLITTYVEMAGVGVIVIGMLFSSIAYISSIMKKAEHAYSDLRRTLGRSILLGLEFLVAADIINTVAVEPTLASVTTLGLIVLIRTFLSFSLGVELEGKFPWQK